MTKGNIMSIKEIIKFKQGSAIIGKMYRVAELTKKEQKRNNKK
jgi:hypothetical protein